MKWRAQIRIDKTTKQVVCDSDFPDGMCDRRFMSDLIWNDVDEFRDAHIYGAFWVKVEYDDEEISP